MYEENVMHMCSWSDCLQFFEGVKSGCLEKGNGEYVSPILFRGQSNSEWVLETTLDRFLTKSGQSNEMTVFDYYRIILAVHPAFASHTGLRFDLPFPGTQAFDEELRRVPWAMPGYAFSVHLRHHEFPSPLLDWTRSPYIAAFFAFHAASIEGSVAIYCFIEDTGKGKESCSDKPRINGHGPYCITHD